MARKFLTKLAKKTYILKFHLSIYSQTFNAQLVISQDIVSDYICLIDLRQKTAPLRSLFSLSHFLLEKLNFLKNKTWFYSDVL